MKISDFDFKKDLSIDKNNLIDECVSHSNLYFNYLEVLVNLRNEVSEIDNKLKYETNKLNIDIRDSYSKAGKKYTESVIESEIALNEEIVKLKSELREKQFDLNVMQSAVSAMESRKSQLDNIVKLLVSGIFTIENKALKDFQEQLKMKRERQREDFQEQLKMKIEQQNI